MEDTHGAARVGARALSLRTCGWGSRRGSQNRTTSPRLGVQLLSGSCNDTDWTTAFWLAAARDSRVEMARELQGDVHGTRGSPRPECAVRNPGPEGAVIAFGAVHDAISRRIPRAPTARLYSIGPSLDWAAGASLPSVAPVSLRIWELSRGTGEHLAFISMLPSFHSSAGPLDESSYLACMLMCMRSAVWRT